MASLYHYLFGANDICVGPVDSPISNVQVVPEEYTYIDPTVDIRLKLAKVRINEEIVNRVQKNIHIDIENIGQLVCEPINARRERENDYIAESPHKRFRIGRGKGRKSAKDTGI